MSNIPLILAILLVAYFLWLWLREKKQAAKERFRLIKKLSSQKTALRNEQDTLLNALTDAIILVNSEGLIVFANESTTELIAGRSAKGRNLTEVFLDERVTTAIDTSMKTGRTIIERVVLPTQTSLGGSFETLGETSWLIDAAPLDRNAKKTVTRVVIRDVTTEHQTEQLRKDFVANASHELRTPLSIINGYLEHLAEGDIEDPAIINRSLTIMQKHGERIARIIDDMLVISRLESEEAVALNISPFNFSHCIHDILERLEPMIAQQKATIKLEFENEDLTLFGDHFYWTQIFFNLIENALKQNPDLGLTIEIGSKRLEDGFQLWVADNGVGIPSADVPFVFRRFYRVEKHHNQERVKGTGLGLSIVKRGVEAHKGTITADSIPGERTSFTILLPLSSEASETIS